MPLSAGQKLGPYEIVAPLGAGGRGEVYRARESRLNRDVAIKTLPVGFASEPGRMATAAIYRLEVGALVMELVVGTTLAERIAQGRIPLEKENGGVVELAYLATRVVTVGRTARPAGFHSKLIAATR